MNAKPHSQTPGPVVVGVGGRRGRCRPCGGRPGRQPGRGHRVDVIHVGSTCCWRSPRRWGERLGTGRRSGRRPASVGVLAAEGVRRRRPRRRDLDGGRPDRARRAAGGPAGPGRAPPPGGPANWSSGRAGTAGHSGCCWARSALFRDSNSGPAGLSSREARRRLPLAGLNELTRHRVRRWPAEVARQLGHPLALLLWLAALLAAVSGTTVPALAIVAVVLLNAAFALVQESRPNGPWRC